MERTRWLAIPILAALTLLFSALPSRADPATIYQNTITMHLSPSLDQLTSFDISFVDPGSNTYVLADRSDKSIDVYDTREDRFVRASDHVFVGVSTSPPSGPNGVYVIPGGGRGNAWAGDGDSTVKVVNLDSGHEEGSVSTGGTMRADELWWAPDEQEIMIGNPDDAPPFESFISTSGSPDNGSLKARLVYDGTGDAYGSSGGNCGPATVGLVSIRECHSPSNDVATKGLEQPVYTRGHSDRDDDRDDGHGRFWLAVPGDPTGTPAGRIDEINPDTFKVIQSIQLTNCIPETYGSPATVHTGPSGLTLISDHEAAAACPSGVDFVNLSTGKEEALVPETGGADEIWYNPADDNVYAPDSNTTLGCANTVATLTSPTGTFTNSCVAVIHAAGAASAVVGEVQLSANAGSHSVAADPGTNQAFVPVKDQTCTETLGCSPPSGTVCPSSDEGGCIHDQGVAVIQLGP